jgi:hypothetical protein
MGVPFSATASPSCAEISGSGELGSGLFNRGEGVGSDLEQKVCGGVDPGDLDAEALRDTHVDHRKADRNAGAPACLNDGSVGRLIGLMGRRNQSINQSINQSMNQSSKYRRLLDQSLKALIQ